MLICQKMLSSYFVKANLHLQSTELHAHLASTHSHHLEAGTKAAHRNASSDSNKFSAQACST
jgi:hypothetical protein